MTESCEILRNEAVAVLHTAVDEGSRADDLDVLVQVGQVTGALTQLGYTPHPVALRLDLTSAVATLTDLRPSFVFNLVEAIGGTDRLQHFAPSILDHLGIDYTGNPTSAIFLTSHKPTMKRYLNLGGIATPPYFLPVEAVEDRPPFDPPYIIKPIGEHASFGIEDDSVLHDRDELRQRCNRLIDEGRASRYFIEKYIDGREFNVSLLGGRPEVAVLPIAEIHFMGYREGKPRIVGYRAKWDVDSYEYHHSPPVFLPEREGDRLSHALRGIAGTCWRHFGLRGYARVDFRVDREGRPWVLEVNTNPCLSPDAGYVAAAGKAGLTLTEVVGRIVEDMRRKERTI